jgi:hypothetical protein
MQSNVAPNQTKAGLLPAAFTVGQRAKCGKNGTSIMFGPAFGKVFCATKDGLAPLTADAKGDV